MSFLTREQILQSNDLVRETIKVPEWGGDVMVRSMTGSERDSFEASTVRTNGKERSVNLVNIRARLCARCIIDPDTGKSLFSEADVRALGDKNAAALDRVFSAAMRLSGMTETDVQELAKNSGSDQSGDSGSV